jgi:hypothetical protein
MARGIWWVAVVGALGLLAVGCGDDGEGGGLFGGSCASACQKLDDCGLCIQDEQGQCLSVSGCTSECNGDEDGKAAAACVNQVSGCDEAAINQCIVGGGEGGEGGEGTEGFETLGI